MKILILALALCGIAFGQPSSNPIRYVTADPTGTSCAATAIALRTPNGTLYTCQSGVYAAAGGSSSGAGGTYCAATGGAANALVCTGSPAPTSLTGLLLSMTVDASNSGATTLNVNSLGVKSILTSTGAAFSANQIAPGTTYIVSYDGTEFILQTISGAAGAPVSVTANKTLGAADAYIPQEMSGTGWTMNAPASLTGLAGACWPLRNVGSGTITVSGNGNSILSNGSTVSSLTMVGAAAPSPGLTLCVDAAGTGLTATGAGPTGPTGPAGSPGSGSSYASNKTPVTVAANTTSDQALQEVSLAAGILNTSGAPFLFHGSGVFTIGLAQTPALTFKAKLCTISGCGSGTVVTLASIATGATVAATNNTWNINLKAINTATGATGTLLVHGPLAIDIGALTTVADTVYNDVNTASSATIDLTASLFVDFTVSTSAGSALNSFTQQIASVEPASSIGATGATGPQGPGGTPQIDHQVTTSAMAMTGTSNDITIYSTAGVTLAAGQCFNIEFGGVFTSTGAGTTVKVKVGTTVVGTLFTGFGAATVNSGRFTYCNNSGVQNAQTYYYGLTPYYGAFTVGVGVTFYVSADGLNGIPTAVDWSTSKTVVLTANGTNGTTTGLFYRIFY